MKEPENILQIGVDSANNVSVGYSGNPRNLLAMLGALDVAKDWVLASIKSNSSQEEVKPVLGEKRVSKNEAMNHYLSQRQEIESRLSSIAQSDDRAQFVIPSK